MTMMHSHPASLLAICIALLLWRDPLVVGALSGDYTCEAVQAAASVSRSGGADNLEKAQEQIGRFLQASDSKGEFLIQGWRWHTMALAREAGRLHKLSRRLVESGSEEDLSSLRKAAEYVVGFNMKGLHKIEKDLFFPWVRTKVDALPDEAEVQSAFGVLMNQLDDDRASIESLGRAVNEVVSIASDPSRPAASRLEAFQELSEKSAAIAERARLMLSLEDSLLVPTIARIVPPSEQKSFNDKVIRNLGILDSRLHLVGMHEAVWELNDEQERALFKKSIPSLPQMMIPRWKRLLYEPRVGVLNNV